MRIVLILMIALGVAVSPVWAASAAKAAGAKAETKIEKAEKKNKSGLPDPDPALVKLKVKPQTTQGTVTGRSAQGVAVEYAVDKKEGGHEIWFNYTEGIKLVGLKELSELQEGDTVSVTYKTAPDNRRLVQEVALVRKKPKEPEAAPEAEPREEEGNS